MGSKKSIKFVLPNDKKKSKKPKKPKNPKIKFVTKKQEKRLENVEEKRNRERALYHKMNSPLKFLKKYLIMITLIMI